MELSDLPAAARHRGQFCGIRKWLRNRETLTKRVVQHEDLQAVAHNVSTKAGRETQVDLGGDAANAWRTLPGLRRVGTGGAPLPIVA